MREGSTGATVVLFVWTAVWPVPPGAVVRWGGGALIPAYSVSSSPPYRYMLSSRGRFSAWAQQLHTWPCLALWVTAVPTGAPCEFLPAWNSRRCLLSPLVPGGLRQDLLLGRTPPPRPPASVCPRVTCSPSLPHPCPDSSHVLNLEQVPWESPSQT